MNKIIFPFAQIRDGELAKTSNRILTSVKGNTFFPDTTLVQELEKRLAEFQSSLDDAADGGRTLIAIKKEKRRLLIEVLTRLAFYVSQVSNGDRAMLLSSGYDLAKENSEPRQLGAIENLVVTTEKPGEASIQVKRVAAARAYTHQYTTDPLSATAVWVSETTAHRKHSFTGLKPLVIYWFRVIAIGLNGQTVISDPVPRLILG
jgi:hypothetical protein